MAVSRQAAPASRLALRRALALLVTVLASVLLPASAQTITTYMGRGMGDGAPATNAILANPVGLAKDANGNIYIAEHAGHRVRKVTPAGVISTIAGTGVAGFSGDGGPATSAQLNTPYDVAVDSGGNVFIVDNANYRICKVDTNGVITTVVGNGTAGFVDGVATTSAMLNSPSSVAIDSAGNLYISDVNNHRIRRVNTSNIISTVAGNGVGAHAGDGGQATSASLNFPNRVVVDSAGRLYIADYFNLRVRRVGTDGVINTIAGNGGTGATGDNGPATSAAIGYPHSVDVDAAGNVFISDSSTRIRVSGHQWHFARERLRPDRRQWNGDPLEHPALRV